MTHWSELSDDQLRIRIARALGQWYWPHRLEVEELIVNRRSEPSWTIIETVAA